MVVIHLNGVPKHYVEILRSKVKLPRFRRANFTGITVRDIALEVVRAKFKNIPDVRGAREVYYPADMGLFVYENLLLHVKLSKAAQQETLNKHNGK